MSEGALFRHQVGAAWLSVPENVRLRFDHDPIPGTVVRYTGVMSTVRCSLIGKILGWLVQRTGALMHLEGTNVPVDIDVWKDSHDHSVRKRRVYHFQDRKPFVFESRMELDANGELAEHVGGGFGMYVRVAAASEGLRFTDAGYFLQIASYRLTLPDWLGPGRVFLCHADVGPHEFRILIEIRHPVFGRLFWQEGVFQHTASSNV